MTDYGIKYHYDYTNDTVGDADQVQFVGKGSVTAWVQLDTGDLYVLGKVGIGYDPTTSGNTYKLYVNGTAYFSIGTSDNTSNLGFIIKGDGRYLSFGGAGVQAYDSSNAASTLYLNFNGGQSYIGGSTYAVGKVGIGYDPDTSGNNYKLYVDGNTFLTDSLYFNDTTYYINNSGTANLYGLTVNSSATFKNSVIIKNNKNWPMISFQGNSNTKDMGYFGMTRSDPGDGDLYNPSHHEFVVYSYNSSTKARLDYREFYILPTITADLTEDKSYNILTTKNTITVGQGGTGRATLTANAVLYGNGTSAIGMLASANGAVYATAANGTLHFGTLPTGQGGTGNTSYTANRLVWTETATKFTAGYHYASSTKIGVCYTSEPSYNFAVSGTSYFNGNTTHNGIDYFANGTTYYINNSADSYLRDVKVRSLGIAQTDGTTGYGISLYNGPQTSAPTYGLMFAKTGTYGTHGGVTSDWATYFTMSDTTNRGWIFRRGSTNVASIDGTGKLYLGYAVNANNPGIYWHPNVESASDASDVGSIYQIKSGVAGGTELRINQQNDATDVINVCTHSYIYFNSKKAFTINDAWLRINEDKGFSSGVYFGTSTVRTDGEFWSDSIRLIDNWVGFYNSVQGTTRYGYIQANADRMYFRKENGVSSYAFDFNGYIYTNSNIYATGTMYADGTMYAHGIWANRASGERQVGVDAGTTGTLYFYSNGSTKGIYSSTGYRTGSVLTINSSSTTFYGALSGNASTATRINGNLTAATSDVNRNIWVSSTASADGIPNYISGFNMNPSTKVFTVPSGTRISPSAGALYLGNSGNQSWVYVQDMASQASGTPWKLTQAGVLTFVSGTMTGNLTVTSTGNNRATVFIRSAAAVPMDLYLGSNNTNYWSISCRESTNPWLGFYWAGGSAGWALTMGTNRHIEIPVHAYVGGYNNTSYSLSTASFICNSWIRTVGNTGWYNETHGGGMYMEDNTWVRVSHSKKFYVANTAGDAINTSGGATISGTVSAGKIDIRPGTNNWAMQVGGNQWGGTGILNGNGDGTGDGTGDLSIASWYGIIFQDGTSWATKAGINCRTGVYYGKGFSNTSSILVKENVKSLSEDKAKKILLTRPVSFDYKKEFGGMKNQFGLIAEELEEILPELVQQPADEKGHKHITYTLIIPFLIKLAQSQQKEIDELKHQIKYLTN